MPSDGSPDIAYFVAYHGRIAGMQNLFARLWKEYALSDSRYLTHDPFILSIEALTVVCPDGPSAQRGGIR
jgi:hypothetical protein